MVYRLITLLQAWGPGMHPPFSSEWLSRGMGKQQLIASQLMLKEGRNPGQSGSPEMRCMGSQHWECWDGCETAGEGRWQVGPSIQAACTPNPRAGAAATACHCCASHFHPNGGPSVQLPLRVTFLSEEGRDLRMSIRGQRLTALPPGLFPPLFPLPRTGVGITSTFLMKFLSQEPKLFILHKELFFFFFSGKVYSV